MDEQQPQDSRKRSRGQSHEATDAGYTPRAQRSRHSNPDQQHIHQALNRQVQQPHAPQHQPDPAAADPLPQQQHQQQHVGAFGHEHLTHLLQQQPQQQPPSLQRRQDQAPQPPLYPQGQRSAAAAPNPHRAMGLRELLDWPLLPLPQDPKPPDYETRERRYYPDNVVSAPDYFEEGTDLVQEVMSHELDREDVYQPVTRLVTAAELVSFLSRAEVVEPTPAAVSAAATPSASASALASAAAASSSASGSLPASASATASAAAAAAAANAAAASGSRRSSRSSNVKPGLLLVERDPGSPPIATIQGMQTLASWLAAHPEMRPQQMRSATARQWQHVSRHTLKMPGVHGKPVYVVEIKAPDKLFDAEGVLLCLDVLFKQFKQGVITRATRSAHSLLGQGFTYMVEFGVDVLILTCYAVSWAIERCLDSPGDLYISKPILATSRGPQSTLLLVILWAHLKGLQQLQEAPLQSSQPIDSGSPDYQPHHSNDDGGGGDDPATRDRSLRDRKPKQLPQDFVSSSQISASQQSNALQQLDQGLGTSSKPSQLKPTQQQQQQLQPAQQQQLQLQQSVLPELPLLHASSLGIHSGVEVLGQGESAVVFRGRLGSLESAVKVLSSLREVVREAGLYKHCQQLQGVVIPEMRGIGKLAPACSGYGFLAVSIIDGVPLSTVRMSSSVRAAAVSAVQALHGCGVVHGDLTTDNMMLLQQQPLGSSSSPSPQQARVMLVDLGRARLATAEEQALELQRLQQELHVVAW